MTIVITPADLPVVDTGGRVADAARAAAQSTAGLLVFWHRYAWWNGYFGSGVATLSGKIGRNRTLFLDPIAPVPELADRSVLVASYFFDAARDEFDDRDTTHRDTHRDLGQATVLGLLRALDEDGVPLDAVRGSLAVPVWLAALGGRVATGYGNGTPDDRASVFRAMGYHLGSEVLADREFTLLDEAMKRHQAPLVERLSAMRLVIAGQAHDPYAWIRIHSGGGGAVEADHFAWAVRGVNLAFLYTPDAERDAMRRQLLLGFEDFARDHDEFFAHVGT